MSTEEANLAYEVIYVTVGNFEAQPGFSLLTEGVLLEETGMVVPLVLVILAQLL